MFLTGIAGGFYEYELHRAANPDMYLVEKVLRKREDAQQTPNINAIWGLHEMAGIRQFTRFLNTQRYVMKKINFSIINLLSYIFMCLLQLNILHFHSFTIKTY